MSVSKNIQKSSQNLKWIPPPIWN